MKRTSLIRALTPSIVPLAFAVAVLCGHAADPRGHADRFEDGNYPAPMIVGDIQAMGSGIQRTMNLLASSTPEKRNTVKVLFYGQSITEQDWWRRVAEDLRRRFPDADLIIENRAIGGHASQLLVKTAEADLYPFYADLVIFHVYGSHIEYENIIRSIRERTTAEILMQNDHVIRDTDHEEETDPAKLSPRNWDPFMNHKFLPETATQYGAELIDQRAGWKRYLKDHGLKAAELLQDSVHLNDHGCYLMAELVKPHLRLNPSVDRESWSRAVQTLIVGHDVAWTGDQLELEFVGNRIDAIASADLAPGEGLEVWIDGKRPSEIPDLRCFTRASAFPRSNWPCLLRVQSDAPLLIEDWTLTLAELSEDHKIVKFTVRGSKTGDDGGGISTERFVSRSGRIVIEPDDWNLGYCRAVFQRRLEPGHTVTWRVVPQYLDVFRPTAPEDVNIENHVTLAQGLRPGRHRLTLRGRGASNLAGLRVYCPPFMNADN